MSSLNGYKLYAAIATLALGQMETLGCTPKQAEHSYQIADPFLQAMAGEWIGNGGFGDRWGQWRISGTPVLQGGFLRLDLIDTWRTGDVILSLFVSYDTRAKDYMAFVMDKNGATASGFGRGKREGDVLTLDVTAEGSVIRYLLTAHPKDDTWSVTLENQKPDSSWEPYAHFDFERTPEKH